MTAEEVGPAEVIGRFADPDATTEVDLGPCRCPGTPHERDSATCRTQWGDGERKAIFYAGAGIRMTPGGALVAEGYDPEAANNELLSRGLVDWTLVDAEGNPVPITRRTVALLDEGTRLPLLSALQESDALFRASLPNASGARSRGSPRASASRSRTPRRLK